MMRQTRWWVHPVIVTGSAIAFLAAAARHQPV
jgi:cobalamin biosynthesis protein CobD/CbiB